MLYTVTYRLQSFLRMQIQLHYFLLHFHIKSNTDIRNYREKESSTPERVKEWSAKEQSHAAWERFVHLSEATCEQQHGGRASHKTCTAWLKALRGDPRSQQYSHLTARVPLACSRLPVCRSSEWECLKGQRREDLTTEDVITWNEQPVTWCRLTDSCAQTSSAPGSEMPPSIRSQLFAGAVLIKVYHY